jgi:hypothetical protein
MKSMFAVQGPKGNWQAPGTVQTLSSEQLDRWARIAAQPKYVGRNLAIFRVGERNRKLEKLYFWEVPEGFEHIEGWWVEV